MVSASKTAVVRFPIERFHVHILPLLLKFINIPLKMNYSTYVPLQDVQFSAGIEKARLLLLFLAGQGWLFLYLLKIERLVETYVIFGTMCVIKF